MSACVDVEVKSKSDNILEPAITEKDYKSILNKIKEDVCMKWHFARDLTFFTPHGVEHSNRVEDGIHELLKENKDDFSKRDWFLLLASAWLHDIGMIPDLFNDDKRTLEWEKEVRKTHHLRSSKYVKDKAERDWNLNEFERRALANICKYHRKTMDLHKIQEKEGIRVKLLTAYLRLADAIHVDKIELHQLKDYQTYLMLGMDIESKFHWLKARCAYRVTTDSRNFKIVITLRQPEVWNREDMEPLFTEFVEEIKDEIEPIKEIVCQGKSAIYSNVEADTIEDDDIDPDELRELKRRLNLWSSPNAGMAIELVLNAIEPNLFSFDASVMEEDLNIAPISEELKDMFKTKGFSLSEDATIRKEKDDKWEITDAEKIFIIRKEKRKLNIYKSTNNIEDLKNHTKYLTDFLRERPCHVYLRKILEMLTKYLEMNTISDQEKIGLIRHKVEMLKKEREFAKEELPKNAKPFLEDGMPILLYGNSDSVILALEYLAKDLPNLKVTMKIYVCECSTKNQYRYNNKLQYSDGIRYSEKVKNLGFNKNNVIIVPDSSVSFLFKNGEVAKVFFGANGIQQETGDMGHSLGHLTIADAADRNKIPVYVIAECMKIGKFKPDPKLQRKGDWLTTDRAYTLKGVKTFNPLEDIVPADRIEYLITEIGRIKPKKLPSDYKTLEEKRQLKIGKIK